MAKLFNCFRATLQYFGLVAVAAGSNRPSLGTTTLAIILQFNSQEDFDDL